MPSKIIVSTSTPAGSKYWKYQQSCWCGVSAGLIFLGGINVMINVMILLDVMDAVVGDIEMKDGVWMDWFLLVQSELVGNFKVSWRVTSKWSRGAGFLRKNCAHFTDSGEKTKKWWRHPPTPLLWLVEWGRMKLHLF